MEKLKGKLATFNNRLDTWTVTLTPIEVQRIIETASFVDEIVFSERYILENDKVIAITVIEKYFTRVSNRASLTIMCDNLSGETKIKAAVCGTSNSWFWKFDWGASKSFIGYVKDLLKEYKV